MDLFHLISENNIIIMSGNGTQQCLASTLFVLLLVLKVQQKRDALVAAMLGLKSFLSTPFARTNENEVISDEEPSMISLIKDICKEENLLGKGYYGAVYKGVLKKQQVAIKQVDKYNLSNLEAELLSQHGSSHQNIIKFLTISEDNSSRYVVMELAASTLAQLFLDDDDPKKYKGPMPSDLQVLHQIASGLNFLHSKNIVHGDVKPENILISLSRPVEMKLSDFGFSKQVLKRTNTTTDINKQHQSTPAMVIAKNDVDSEVDWARFNKEIDSAVSFTLTGVRGTPIWMAPELHVISAEYSSEELQDAAKAVDRNPIKVSTAVDMFSFGLVSFYYLTGGIYHPFGPIKTRKDRYLIPHNIIKRMMLNSDKLHKIHPLRNLIVLEMMNYDDKERITAADVLKYLSPFTGIKHSGVHHPFTDVPETEIDEEPDSKNADINSWDHLFTFGDQSSNVMDNKSQPQMWIVTLTLGEDRRLRIKLKRLLKKAKQHQDSSSVLSYDEAALENDKQFVSYFLKESIRSQSNKNTSIDHDPLFLFCGNKNDLEAETQHMPMPEKMGILFPISHPRNITIGTGSIIQSSTDDDEEDEDEHSSRFYGLIVQHFYLEQLKLFIQLLFPKQSFKNSPLLAVCHSYQHDNLKEIIQYLLYDNENDVNAKDEQGSNALHLLICRHQEEEKRVGNFIEIIRLFLNNEKFEINAKNGEGSNALHLLFTTSENVIEIFNLFIERGIDVNSKDDDNWNALDYLCRYYVGNDMTDIIRLLIANNLNVDSKRSNGSNALVTACRFHTRDDLLDIVRLLVENKIDVNARMDQDLNSLLSLCCFDHQRKNLVDIIRYLLDNKVDVHYKNKDNWNALTIICQYYRSGDSLLEIIRLLIDRGIDVNSTRKQGWNALMCLDDYRGRDKLQVIRFLIESGIDVNTKAYHGGHTALLLMCRNNYAGRENDNMIEIIRLLLDNEADVNARDDQGWNALITLFRYYGGGHLYDLVNLLIQHSIDVNAKTLDGIDALTTLTQCQNGRKDLIRIIRLLVDNNIDVHFKNKGGMNALMSAVRYYRGPDLIDIVRLFVIELDLDVNATNGSENGNWNALHMLVRSYSGSDHLLPIIKVLVDDGGIDVGATCTDHHWDALVTVCRFYGGDDLKHIIRFLVDRGIDPRATNKEGSNALHYVCQYYRGPDLLEIVRHLVEQCQVDVNLQDIKGNNALHFLHMFNRDLNRLDVINYLLIKSLWRDQDI